MESINPRLTRSMALAIVSSFTVVAVAQDAPTVSVKASLDFYYQNNLDSPRKGKNVNLRQFDIEHNTINLAAARIDFAKPWTEASKYGLTVSILGGKNSEILFGNKDFEVLQAFATIAVPGTKFVVDIGRFLAPHGYEGVNSYDNVNYSRSMLYYASQAIYHTGIRTSMPIGGGFTATGYVVNGWNDKVDDTNKNKTIGLSVGGSLGAATTGVLNYIVGNEFQTFIVPPSNDELLPGDFATVEANVNLLDLVLEHKLSDKLKVALNADYGNAKPIGGGSTAKWSGIALYAKLMLSEKAAAGLRFETFNDSDGIRTGSASNYQNITANYDLNVNPMTLVRAELRFDTSNDRVYVGKNSSLKDKRTTLTLSSVFKF